MSAPNQLEVLLDLVWRIVSLRENYKYLNVSDICTQDQEPIPLSFTVYSFFHKEFSETSEENS
jgi:hypothetical protein